MTTLLLKRAAVAGLLALAACAPAPYRYQAPPAAVAPVAAPQLLFLAFRMTAPAGAAHRLELLQAQAVPGEVSSTALTEPAGPTHLQLTQLDDRGQPCGPAYPVAHPLLRDVEAPAADGGGALVRRTAWVPEAEFFVRLARQPGARRVRVAEVGPDLTAPTVQSFLLP